MKNIYSKNQISILKIDCFTASAVKVLEKVFFFLQKLSQKFIIEFKKNHNLLLNLQLSLFFYMLQINLFEYFYANEKSPQNFVPN